MQPIAPLRLWLVLPLIAALSGAAPPVSSTRFDPSAYAHAQHLVDVGNGRKVNAYCTGTGSPTVLLDSGGGGWTFSWRYTQPLVAKFTRVCSYDRAGLGFSDSGPLPRTTAAIVSDLHALLHNAGIAPPYILVGHSMGSFDARLFADEYGSEVAGMVLVDPSGEDENARFEKIFPKLATFDKDTELPQLRGCAVAAQQAQLNPQTPEFKNCIPPPDPKMDPALQRAFAAMSTQPKLWNTLLSELESEDTYDRGELQAAARSFGSMPLIVLTGGAQFKQFQNAIGMNDAQVVQAQRAWTEMHDQLAKLSTRGVNESVAGAGHDIHVSNPAEVAKAIQQVLEESRSR